MSALWLNEAICRRHFPLGRDLPLCSCDAVTDSMPAAREDARQKGKGWHTVWVHIFRGSAMQGLKVKKFGPFTFQNWTLLQLGWMLHVTTQRGSPQWELPGETSHPLHCAWQIYQLFSGKNLLARRPPMCGMRPYAHVGGVTAFWGRVEFTHGAFWKLLLEKKKTVPRSMHELCLETKAW